MRAVIYARYSTDLQREASIEDQVEVCRREVERQGWTVVKIYADPALSGASRFRPQYQQMIADAEQQQFDVVVCEALDRLGRKLADIADLHDRLSFCDVKIHTVRDWTRSPRCTSACWAPWPSSTSQTCGRRSGAASSAVPGKDAFLAASAYGYRVIAERDASGGGRRQIDEAEAAVVRRIFQDYAAGISPRTIAKRLNDEHVPGPSGREWRGTQPSVARLAAAPGCSNNSVYVGRLEWNRTAYVKDPRTGRRVARVNKQELRETVEVLELRIIDYFLWQRVKGRQQEARIEMGKDEPGNALNRAHRRKFLLSELLVCGHCGGRYTVVGKDRYGCATWRARAPAATTWTITRQRIEARVLGGLKDKLMAPELVAEFVRAFQDEINAAAEAAAARAEQLRREAEVVERKIVGILAAIEDGMYTPVLKERMKVLETRKAEILGLLASAQRPSVVRLHPDDAEIYRRKVADLELALNDDSIKAEAGEIRAC